MVLLEFYKKAGAPVSLGRKRVGECELLLVRVQITNIELTPDLECVFT